MAAVPDDFIETEINRILLILEKHCDLFGVDRESPKLKELAEEVVAKESEPKHANR